jgi:UDP-N-acetyl-D-glucosamine dehydrogenase
VSARLNRCSRERGAVCDVHDPFVPVVPNLREHPTMAGRKSVPLDPAGVAGYDAVLIVTDHDAIDYMSLPTAPASSSTPATPAPPPAPWGSTS